MVIAFEVRRAGAEVPEPLVTAEEDSNDLVLLNNTLTEAMLVVFHVAYGSVLGSGFSATYSRVHQGLASVIIASCSAQSWKRQSAAHAVNTFTVAPPLHHWCGRFIIGCTVAQIPV